MTSSALAVTRDTGRFCGARKRQGEGACRRGAGWGTDHSGSGRCKLHGGRAQIRSGRYSGIKRQELRDAIEKHQADPDPLNLLPEIAAARALFEDFINRYHEWRDAFLAWHQSYSSADRPLSPESILLLSSVIDEYEALLGEQDEDLNEKQLADMKAAREFVALLGSPLDQMKPRRIMDIADAYKLLAEIRQQVATIENIDAQNAISRRDLFRVLGEMGRTVDLLVTDDFGSVGAGKALKTKIKDSWNSIRLA